MEGGGRCGGDETSWRFQEVQAEGSSPSFPKLTASLATFCPGWRHLHCCQSLCKRLRKHGGGVGGHGNQSLSSGSGLLRERLFNRLCISVFVSFMLGQDPRHSSAQCWMSEVICLLGKGQRSLLSGQVTLFQVTPQT